MFSVRPAQLNYVFRLFVESLVFGMLALEFRNKAFHRGNDCHVVGTMRCAYHLAYSSVYIRVVIFAYFGDLDLVVVCRQRDFLVVEYFLVEFLAVAETSIKRAR